MSQISEGHEISPERGESAPHDDGPGDLALPEGLDAIATPPAHAPDARLDSFAARIEEAPTLEGLEKLIRGLQGGTIDARTLDRKERRAIVTFLADSRATGKDGKPGRFVTRETLSRLLKVSVHTITADIVAIRKAAGNRLVRNWGVDGAVGFLEKAAMDCYREARELGDPGLGWMIASNFVKQLKDLGAFGGAKEQDGFRVTFETVGPQLAALTRKLEEAFRPELTGERIVEGRALPLPQKLEGEELPPAGVVSPDGEDTDPNSGLIGEVIEASGDPFDSETIEGQ